MAKIERYCAKGVFDPPTYSQGVKVTGRPDHSLPRGPGRLRRQGRARPPRRLRGAGARGLPGGQGAGRGRRRHDGTASSRSTPTSPTSATAPTWSRSARSSSARRAPASTLVAVAALAHPGLAHRGRSDRGDLRRGAREPSSTRTSSARTTCAARSASTSRPTVFARGGPGLRHPRPPSRRPHRRPRHGQPHLVAAAQGGLRRRACSRPGSTWWTSASTTRRCSTSPPPTGGSTAAPPSRAATTPSPTTASRWSTRGRRRSPRRRSRASSPRSGRGDFERGHGRADAPATPARSTSTPSPSRVRLARRLKVVVDAGNGIAGSFAPELLRRLGCEVVELYCESDGTFPNHLPDPEMEENTRDLVAKVLEVGADVGHRLRRRRRPRGRRGRARAAPRGRPDPGPARPRSPRRATRGPRSSSTSSRSQVLVDDMRAARRAARHVEDGPLAPQAQDARGRDPARRRGLRPHVLRRELVRRGRRHPRLVPIPRAGGARPAARSPRTSTACRTCHSTPELKAPCPDDKKFAVVRRAGAPSSSAATRPSTSTAPASSSPRAGASCAPRTPTPTSPCASRAAPPAAVDDMKARGLRRPPPLPLRHAARVVARPGVAGGDASRRAERTASPRPARERGSRAAPQKPPGSSRMPSSPAARAPSTSTE